MTSRLSPDSRRKKYAIQFGNELRRAMKAKSVGQVRLSAAAGVSAAAIANYRNAHNLPTMRTAHLLSEVLDAPHLLTIAQAGRTIECENCGKGVLVEEGTPRRFCTPECLRVASAKKSGSTTRERAVVSERMLRMHRDAVAAMCWSCEPQGLCRTPTCELRMVSPLAIATRDLGETTRILEPRTNGAAWLRASREANAKRWTPEARAAQSVANRARFAAMNDEERDAFAAKVRAGKRTDAA